MVLLLVVGPSSLPEYRDPDAGRIDLPAPRLSLVAVLAAIYGLKQSPSMVSVGWRSSRSLQVSSQGYLLRGQRSLRRPAVDLSLFRLPAFSASLVTFMLGAVAAFGSFVFIAQYLQLVEGLSPLEAGSGRCRARSGSWLVPR